MDSVVAVALQKVDRAPHAEAGATTRVCNTPIALLKNAITLSSLKTGGGAFAPPGLLDGLEDTKRAGVVHLQYLPAVYYEKFPNTLQFHHNMLSFMKKTLYLEECNLVFT